jgi:hypothetical protein
MNLALPLESAPALRSWAIFSECRRWRYVLGREWDPRGTSLVVIGHNPSTADETQDDPTIRRCINYAKRWGHGRYIMLNLCGWRDTDPNGLNALDDPTGPENDFHILEQVRRPGMVLAAWGTLAAKAKNPPVRARPERVLSLVSQFADVHALKITGEGHPWHPLYCNGDVTPVLYRGKV